MACAPTCSASVTLLRSRCRAPIIVDIRAAFPVSNSARRVHEFIRRLIGLLIEDVTAETRRRLAALAPRSADDVRQAPSGVARFSTAVTEAEDAIKEFLRTHRVPS